MQQILLVFANTNHAIRAEALLLEANLPVQVMPLPSVIHAGCGICLRVPQAQVTRAAALLQAHGAPPEELYAIHMDGPQSRYTHYTPEGPI